MSDFDPQQYRQDSVEQWEAAAPGWSRRAEQMQRLASPVPDWLLAPLELKPGQRVLDLAAGLGHVGLEAARRVAPGGSVVIADQAGAMLGAARERAQPLRDGNVRR